MDLQDKKTRGTIKGGKSKKSVKSSRFDYWSYTRRAVLQMCSVKKVFLEILQNSHKSYCARVSFLIYLLAWDLVPCVFCVYTLKVHTLKWSLKSIWKIWLLRLLDFLLTSLSPLQCWDVKKIRRFFSVELTYKLLAR